MCVCACVHGGKSARECVCVCPPPCPTRSLDTPGAPGPSGLPPPLLRPEGCDLLDSITELDYLTHIVLRMYENKAVPMDSPGGRGAGGIVLGIVCVRDCAHLYVCVCV